MGMNNSSVITRRITVPYTSKHLLRFGMTGPQKTYPKPNLRRYDWMSRGICLIWPPACNSDHQDYYMFSRGFLLTFIYHCYWKGGQPKVYSTKSLWFLRVRSLIHPGFHGCSQTCLEFLDSEDFFSEMKKLSGVCGPFVQWKKPGCLGYIGDCTSYVGIIIHNYKDPYSTTSISWKVRLVFLWLTLKFDVVFFHWFLSIPQVSTNSPSFTCFTCKMSFFH